MAKGSAAPPTTRWDPSPQPAGKVVRNTSDVNVYFDTDKSEFAVGQDVTAGTTLLEPGEATVTEEVTYFATVSQRASLDVSDYEGSYGIDVPVQPETIAVPADHVVTNNGPGTVYWDVVEADADSTNGTALASGDSVETAALTYFAVQTSAVVANVTVRDPEHTELDQHQVYAAVKAIIEGAGAVEDDETETVTIA